MTAILRETFPENKIAVLSGPNLATEVARDLPTATVVACDDGDCAARLQTALGSSRFRVYTSLDVVSVELGGALKNVFAIAAGISDGLSLGDNAKAAVVTRSLAELVRFGVAMPPIPPSLRRNRYRRFRRLGSLTQIRHNTDPQMRSPVLRQ